eukprot:4429526-Pleurochrysis_carterae.AAC.1
MNRRQRNQAASFSMNELSGSSATGAARTSSSLPIASEPSHSSSTMAGFAGSSTGSEWLSTPAPHVRTVGAPGSRGPVTGSSQEGQ